MTLKEFEIKWGHVDRNYTTFEEELELVEDAFEMYEETGFLDTFESPYDDKSKNGLPFKVIRRASYVQDDIDLECLPQWVIEFENKEQMFCFPEEICKIEKQ